MKELIEKYEKEIETIKKIDNPKGSIHEACCGQSIFKLEMVIDDLKELNELEFQDELKMLKDKTVLNKIEHCRNDNPYPPLAYPPLRERLICACVDAQSKRCESVDNEDIASDVIDLANKIIKQLKQE